MTSPQPGTDPGPLAPYDGILLLSFGGPDKATETIELAAKFLRHVGLSEFEKPEKAGTLMYDPRILILLAYRARIAGLDKK